MFSLFKYKVVETRTGSLGQKLQVKHYKGKYILDAEHVNYSFGGLHKVFRDAFRHKNMENRKVRDVLILGFGAGSVADILSNEYKKNCRITGVEADAVVLEFARKYFKLDKYNHLELHQMDALEFAEQNQEDFDLVIIDLYEDFRVPAFAESAYFLKLIHRHMKKEGLMFFNKMIYNVESEVSAAKLKANLIDTFAEVEELRIKYSVSNTMFVCKK